MNGLFFGNTAMASGGDPSLPKEYQRCEWVGNYEGASSSGIFISIPWDDEKLEELESSFLRFSAPYATSYLFHTLSTTNFGFKKNTGDFRAVVNGIEGTISYDSLWHKVRFETVNNTTYNVYVDDVLKITSDRELIHGNSISIFRGVYCYFGVDYIKFTLGGVKYNLVACYRKSDDVAGLYDLENKVFYPATNSFQLKHGADKQNI